MRSGAGTGNTESQINVYLPQEGTISSWLLRRHGDFIQIYDAFKGQLVAGAFFGVSAEQSVFEVVSGPVVSQLNDRSNYYLDFAYT